MSCQLSLQLGFASWASTPKTGPLFCAALVGNPKIARVFRGKSETSFFYYILEYQLIRPDLKDNSSRSVEDEPFGASLVCLITHDVCRDAQKGNRTESDARQVF